MKLNKVEINVQAGGFLMCLADSAEVLFSKFWPLPHRQKYLKIIVTQRWIFTLPCVASVKEQTYKWSGDELQRTSQGYIISYYHLTVVSFFILG